jgi:hypothetical protein
MSASRGGALAEEAVFGDVEPFGVEKDFRLAFARHGLFGIQQIEDSPILGVMQELAGRLRRAIRRRRPMLLRLARTLLRAERLSRRDCARILRSVGFRGRTRPRFSPLVALTEREAGERAQREVDDHRRRLKAWA